MVHRGRSLRSETEPHTGSSNVKQFRQFTTRSRAKSTASFKGLRRVLTHDGTFDEGHGRHSSFQKCKSSDALSRKRVISGLSMTTLTRVKSNPGSVVSPTRDVIGNFGGIKPTRSKSTHSVLNLQEIAERFNREGGAKDDSSVDEDEDEDEQEEEVDYFSDDSEKEKPNNHENAGPISYKPPSKFIKEEDKVDGANIENVSIRSTDNDTKNVGSQPVIVEDDHIDHSNLNEIDVGNVIEPSLHTLTRQGSMFANLPKKVTDKEKIVLDKIDTSNDSSANAGPATRIANFENDNNNLFDKPPMDTNKNNNKVSKEKYIPTMILSQSTGMERTFEGPPSIQNSLANVLDSPIDKTSNEPIDNGDKLNDVNNSNNCLLYTSRCV